MIRRTILLAVLSLAVLAIPTQAVAAENCDTEPRPECFGIASIDVELSTTQAGDHPNLTLDVAVAQNPKSKPNVFGEPDAYATTRNLRFEVPPGVIGNPNVLGVPQQCTSQELITYNEPGGGCPNGSQIGISEITAYGLMQKFREPIFMMAPPGGDVVARLGLIAGLYPTFIDFRVRSESDYGLVSEVREAPAAARVIRLVSTFWGVPSDESHDTERCTAQEAFEGCVETLPRPPGSRQLPFMTNPTRCGAALEMKVHAESWEEPGHLEEIFASTPFPAISGCDKLPFGPGLTVEPTSRRPSSPTGLDMTIRLPEAEGPEVLEPAQTRDIRIELPQGIAVNPGSGDGLGTCSAQQVRFGTRENAQCPDSAKMAATEFEVGALPRRMQGAIYLREPEPGNLFRIWVVADDLGAHVKLPGQLDVDEATGQIDSLVLDNPQVPLREVKLLFKSGFRAPLITPPSCGTYFTSYEFTSWAGSPPAKGQTPMQITEGCEVGGFSPKLSAGSTDAQGGAHSPFTFTLTREDTEENVAGFGLTLPKGMTASFAGIARCEGADAVTGNCPASSRVGKVVVADGVGPSPLWVPQPGKDPTAIYLGGPYKGAPLSIVAVVPAQAGPFDLGDEVVRSAITVDSVTAEATATTDPLPQFIEGIPIIYRAINAQLDRPGFALNPTSCARKETTARVTSTGGLISNPTSPYAASDCAKLGFAPRISFRLIGGTRRGAHPKLTATVRMPRGGANIASTSVALPRSEFLDQAHIKTVCTRVQFAADSCPAGSIYGKATAISPLFDFSLQGNAILRSSDNELPDLVLALKGPPSMPIEVDVAGRIDTDSRGGIRTTFEQIPDAPISSFTLRMQGGAKGLLINSANLCRSTNRAVAKFKGHNGKTKTLRPALQSSCKKKRK